MWAGTWPPVCRPVWATLDPPPPGWVSPSPGCYSRTLLCSHCQAKYRKCNTSYTAQKKIHMQKQSGTRLSTYIVVFTLARKYRKYKLGITTENTHKSKQIHGCFFYYEWNSCEGSVSMFLTYQVNTSYCQSLRNKTLTSEVFYFRLLMQNSLIFDLKKSIAAICIISQLMI